MQPSLAPRTASLLRAAIRTRQNAIMPARAGGARTFSSFPSLRPTLPGFSSSSASVFRPQQSSLARMPASLPMGADLAAADLVPRTAITAHPAFGGAAQIRCGPRPTMARSSRLIQKRRHGFLGRIKTKLGRKMLARRRAKGRKRLAC